MLPDPTECFRVAFESTSRSAQCQTTAWSVETSLVLRTNFLPLAPSTSPTPVRRAQLAQTHFETSSRLRWLLWTTSSCPVSSMIDLQAVQTVEGPTQLISTLPMIVQHLPGPVVPRRPGTPSVLAPPSPRTEHHTSCRPLGHRLC
jgi:hypothetical protein